MGMVAFVLTKEKKRKKIQIQFTRCLFDLQLVQRGIKMNSKIIEVRQKDNLLFTVKFY